MDQPVSPSTGWGVLHLFCRAGPRVDRHAVVCAARGLEAKDHQVVSVALLGHKADVGFLAIGPDLRRLRRFQSGVQGAGLEPVASYVSLTEVSEYAAGMPEEVKEARLHPRLPPPDKPAFSFYPMSKRRQADANWYLLAYEERKRLMLGHGALGRRFAGRVLQLITGSAGLDDFEWGVTLFASRPDDLKDVVYQMRFDEASARYAEFGPFYSGIVSDVEDVLGEAGAV